MPDEGRGGAQPPTGQRPNPRLELLQRKGLGHVVVRPQIQSLDTLIHAVGRREDEHRTNVAARAQAHQHVQAVHLRQTQVQDQKVELVGCQRRISLCAAGHLVHRVAPSPQRAQQPVGKHLVILRDQNPHGVSPHGARRNLAAPATVDLRARRRRDTVPGPSLTVRFADLRTRGQHCSSLSSQAGLRAGAAFTRPPAEWPRSVTPRRELGILYRHPVSAILNPQSDSATTPQFQSRKIGPARPALRNERCKTAGRTSPDASAPRTNPRIEQGD